MQDVVQELGFRCGKAAKSYIYQGVEQNIWRNGSPPYPAPISSYLFNISDLNQCYRFIICNIWYHVLRCKPMLRVRIAVRKVTADEGVKSGENQ